MSATAQAARDLQEITNKEYRYFGNLHLVIDTGHSLHLSETQHFIETLELAEDIRQEAVEYVDKVFQLFTDFFSVILEQAKTTTATPSEESPSISASGFPANSKWVQKQSVQLLIAQKENALVPASTGKRLGAYLLEAGLLSHDRLEFALNKQKETDKRLGKWYLNKVG